MKFFFPARVQDIDRRNLISLTGSPVEKTSEIEEPKEIWSQDQVKFFVIIFYVHYITVDISGF